MPKNFNIKQYPYINNKCNNDISVRMTYISRKMLVTKAECGVGSDNYTSLSSLDQQQFFSIALTSYVSQTIVPITNTNCLTLKEEYNRP